MPALTIAWSDLRRTLRERQNVFWIFVAPLIFAGFFGMLLQPSPQRPTVLSIVDQDPPGDLARLLSAALEADGIRTRMTAAVPASGLAVVVPKGAFDALAAGSGVKLVLHAGVEQTNQERRVQFKLEKALIDVTMQGASVSGGSADRPKGPLSIAPASLEVRRQANTHGFQYAIPAYLVMFAFMNLLVSGARLAEERASGLLRRLALMPVSFRQIIAAKLLHRVVIGWTQMGYLLLVGVFVFHVEWGANPLMLFAFLSLLALVAGALGILIGTIFDDPDKCANLAIWSVIVLSPLGGLWWPLEIVGPTLRQVANFVPTGWAMQAVNSIMAFGAGPRDVAPFAAALAGLFVVSFVLAAHRLRRQVVA